MRMKTIYRLPERLMPGTYEAIIETLDLQECTSPKGNTYEMFQFKLLVFYEEYGITMSTYYKVPYFWYADGKLVKLARAFDILPEIGEALQIESLIHMPVEIEVEENVYNGNMYSNVVDMVPLVGDLPVPLQEWLDQHSETRQLTDALFDDERENTEEEEPFDENSDDEEIAEEEKSVAPASSEKLFHSRQPPFNPLKRRKMIGSKSSSGVPIRKPQEGKANLGDL